MRATKADDADVLAAATRRSFYTQYDMQGMVPKSFYNKEYDLA